MKISAKGRYGLAAMTYLARSYAAGAASARDLEDAQYSAAAAEYTVKLDRYALQSAYFSYLAGRDGLAGSSAS